MDKSTKELLAQAEKLCAQRNVRLTPQRLEVLRLMSLQQGAISAYDLLDLLRESEPQAKPPTVYRALDFLLEQGFVHKVESTNSYVLCHLFDQPTHTSAMFICDRCGGVKESARKASKILCIRWRQEWDSPCATTSLRLTACAPPASRLSPAVRRATATTTIPSRSKRKPAEALAAAGIKGVYPSYFKLHVRWLCYSAHP